MFVKGQSGNPAGRPVGSKDARTIFRDEFRERGEKVVNRILDEAEAGNWDAMKFIGERVVGKLTEGKLDVQTSTPMIHMLKAETIARIEELALQAKKVSEKSD